MSSTTDKRRPPDRAPPVVDRAAFDAAVTEQVAREKEVTRLGDLVSADRHARGPARRARLDHRWVSSFDTTSHDDRGWTQTDDSGRQGQRTGYSYYLLRDRRPYLTYMSTARGTEAMLPVAHIIDPPATGASRTGRTARRAAAVPDDLRLSGRSRLGRQAFAQRLEHRGGRVPATC